MFNPTLHVQRKYEKFSIKPAKKLWFSVIHIPHLQPFSVVYIEYPLTGFSVIMFILYDVVDKGLNVTDFVTIILPLVLGTPLEVYRCCNLRILSTMGI